MTSQTLFDDLATVRRLLASSPLMSSLDLAVSPLSRAVDVLRSQSLTDGERERLRREVAAVGTLLSGVGLWLSTLGALTPTYNRHAELDSSSLRGSGLVLEG